MHDKPRNARPPLPKRNPVQKAVSILDRISLSLASALRHNSLARVVFPLYFILLHLWVFVVLYMSLMQSMEVLQGGADIPSEASESTDNLSSALDPSNPDPQQ